MREVCGGLLFTSDFESGNLAKVEFVTHNGKNYGVGNSENNAAEESCKIAALCPFQAVGDALCIRGSVQSSNNQKSDTENKSKRTSQTLEFNAWIHADCVGTPYENINRTWFHFGVQGGCPDSMIKINIVNMNRQSKLFAHGMTPVYRIVPGKEKWNRIPRKPTIQGLEESNFILSFCHKLPSDTSSTTYFAFTFPFTYTECQEMLNAIDRNYLAGVYKSTESSGEDEIYYYRELASHSLDGHRIDVLTITSQHGKTDELESRLPHLFLDTSQPRSHIFEGKRVVFVSSRVHPGETPSSFVFNGLLQFLLSPTDIRAVMLRRLFVFKLIPMLNPDGVVRGHYRTDSRGVNLNRVYLGANILLHPTIYAARSLFLYYHKLYAVEDSENSSNIISSCLSSPNLETDLPDVEEHVDDMPKTPLQMTNQSSPPEHIEKSLVDVSLKFPSVEHTNKTVFAMNDINNIRYTGRDANFSQSNKITFHNHAIVNEEKKTVTDQFDQKSITTENKVKSAESVEYTNSDNKDNGNKKPDDFFQKETQNQIDSELVSSDTYNKKNKCTIDVDDFRNEDVDENRIQNSENRDKVQLKMSNSKTEMGDFNDTSCATDTCKIETSTSDEGDLNLDSFDIPLLPPERSGIAYYIDLHGHASKRGCFFYGNYFSDLEKKAESWTLAKLMSLNCPNFDYGACNFSCHNMYAGGRREGQSKKGSGRVAFYLLTGIIHSYTLECNYNTGRTVNNTVKVEQDGHLISPVPGKAVPYYSPTVYQQVGRALAISILDATGQNPISRLTNTCYKTMEGVRNWLCDELDSDKSRKQLKDGKCHSWSSGYNESTIQSQNTVPREKKKQPLYNKHDIIDPKRLQVPKNSDIARKKTKQKHATSFISTSPLRSYTNLLKEQKRIQKENISKNSVDNYASNAQNKSKEISENTTFNNTFGSKTMNRLNKRNSLEQRKVPIPVRLSQSTTTSQKKVEFLQKQWECINKRNSFPITKCTLIPTLNILSLFTERKIPSRSESLEREKNQRTVSHKEVLKQQGNYNHNGLDPPLTDDLFRVKLKVSGSEPSLEQVQNTKRLLRSEEIKEENAEQSSFETYRSRGQDDLPHQETELSRCDTSSDQITRTISEPLPQISKSSASSSLSSSSANSVNTKVCTVELPRLSPPDFEISLYKKPITKHMPE